MALTRSGTESRRARGLVSGACAGLPEALVDDARLLTAELVSNAIRYGTGHMEMRVQAAPDQVLVEVWDQSVDEPKLLPLDPERPGGHGMRVVEAIAHQWGVTHFPNAKSVWFVVR